MATKGVRAQTRTVKHRFQRRLGKEKKRALLRPHILLDVADDTVSPSDSLSAGHARRLPLQDTGPSPVQCVRGGTF